MRFNQTALTIFSLVAVNVGVEGAALAGVEQVGTITQMQGEVQIFSHPSKDVQGPPPHALFEGENYSVHNAKVGEKVDQGNIVRTSPGAMAKVIYENGDQMHVGPSSAYRIHWEDQANNDKTSVRLLYGKMRNVISKFGPRNNLDVKTSDVTMGVRGTDFYVSKRGEKNVTEITTLRGKVAVKAAQAPANEKPIEVTPGFTAVVQSAGVEKKAEGEKAPEKVAPVEVRKTSREEIQVIKKVSNVVNAEIKNAEVEAPIQKKVEALEKKAVEATLNDIKASDKKLYAEVTADKGGHSEAMNNKTLDRIFEKAPSMPQTVSDKPMKKMKPSEKDLEEESDSYGRYFKAVE